MANLEAMVKNAEAVEARLIERIKKLTVREQEELLRKLEMENEICMPKL